MQYALEFVAACWGILTQMAPYLLFGFLMAGVLSVVISPSRIERHLGGRGLGPVLKSALFGVPLPLCSCSVIPVTASLRRHGAGRGATTAFLLSTPSTCVDSILATYALLGPVFTIIRPIAAFVMGVVGGGLVSAVEGNGHAEEDASEPPTCHETCCSAEGRKQPAILRALRYGFDTLPGDIAKALLIGVAIAGVLGAAIEENALGAYLGGGVVSMLVMMAVGIPIYVCSTASIPIALGFMHVGVSPGAALVFLIAGPATNAATVAVVWQLLGKRTAVVYFLTVALGALGFGLALDLIYTHVAIQGVALHAAHETTGWLGHVLAAVLLGVLARSLVIARLRSRAGAVKHNHASPSPAK